MRVYKSRTRIVIHYYFFIAVYLQRTKKNKMKSFFCCVIVLLICVYAEADCEYDDESLPVGKHHRKCITITCFEDGSTIAVPCPEVRCQEEEQIGYQELDLSKPYPDCCPRPICKS